ncbi:transposable element P transposase [Trichonephila clavipes]|nr:transposable element P transposase [Trichonephila clavipes]
MLMFGEATLQCKELQDHEKHVILQMDEIFIKSAITYKCNKIIGFTEKGEAATTIQCFLYSSLLSKNKEIVSLNPAKNMNTEDLYSMTLEILSLMENVGFSVCIVSDNNRVNRDCFSKLCNGTIKSVIQNPANNAKKLHLIFDSVHLIKSIRNNWLSQKDADSSLMYPDPSEFSQIRKASFSSLFKIYNEEMNIIVKLAPKLCLKALKPTNFEKQNVKLVLKFFEESNVTALNILKDKLGYPEMFRDTAIFIKYILDFWQIMNIKNQTKGPNLKLKNSVPFSLMEDDRFTFFSKFVQWLDCWKNLKQNEREGCLSEETLFALRHTVNTTPELIKYLLTEQNFKYVLTGKFQTDNLEARFGQYRQMSGANYHVTVQEILQAVCVCV